MITIVVAKAANNVIGDDNQLIWHLPNDLKHFKAITSGHPIIMGRKTFDSIGKPLPNRTNIVITRNQSWEAEGVIVVNSLENAIEEGKKWDENVFIIGGGNIYNQAIEIADYLEVTEIHENFNGDTAFPEIDVDIWEEVDRQDFQKDKKNTFDYSFVRYKRKV